MSDQTDIPELEESEGTGGVRGKAYPAISLEKAVERAEVIRNAGLTRSALPESAFYKLWGFKGASGPSRRVLAALNHYGLLDSLGKGKDRKLKLSDLALRILLDKVPGSAARSAALKEAALKPEIFTKLLNQFPFGVGTDQGIETFLTLTCGFLDEPAKIVKAAWRDTLAFAGLDKPDNLTPEPDVVDTSAGKTPLAKQEIEVGDLVQVEIAGALQLPKAARVRAIQEDQGVKWAFIEGSNAGVLMEQVILEQKRQEGKPPLVPPRLAEEPSEPGIRKLVIPLTVGGDAILSFPEQLVPEGFEELGAYLQLFLERAKSNAEKKLAATKRYAPDIEELVGDGSGAETGNG